MEPTEAWSGEFGNEYTKRNRVDWRKRIPFWKHIIDVTGARSAFELGCNAGWNLSAIQRVDPMVSSWGVDINPTAIEQAKAAGLDAYCFGASQMSPKEPFSFSELTFTAGVLIHIPPEELNEVMQRLALMSCDYVLAIEYDAEEVTEIEYRGQSGLLWMRPYGDLYEDLGLTLVETNKVQMDVGFDNCRYWLLQK